MEVDSSGLKCLLTMAEFHGVAADERQIKHTFGEAPLRGDTLLLAAKGLKLRAKRVSQHASRLDKVPLPSIASDQNGRFFILAKFDAGSREGTAKTASPQSSVRPDAVQPTRLLIQHPGKPPVIVSLDEFLASWSGELIFITSSANFASETARFDFTWFIPAVVKYRRMLGEVLIASFMLQLFALITPLFFQVVMDKVLVNHAMETLTVIAVGLICVTIFEVVLSAIRTYIFAHTSSKIDVELGARLFRHLLALPIAYFQSRRIGDSVARIRELENIRSFLTGSALTLVLDLVFSVVFIAVMLWYSAPLTVIVSIPAYVALSLFFTPVLRARLNEKFDRGAENQAFLVESISGIDTLKSMAAEPRWRDKWDEQLAGYVTASLASANISNIASSGVTGFVYVGQSAAVKIDAFEYTKYGTLPGRVTHVSQDAIDDDKRGLIFAVKVELDKSTLDIKGHETPVTTGMSVNVEIKTGRCRVIEYVMSPLLRHTGEALDER